MPTLTETLEQIWNTPVEPQLGYTTWEGYLYLCDKLGIVPDSTLTPGRSVEMTPGHVRSI